jgi:serine/threonine protein kinase/ankyrin repeat protein
MDEHYQAITTVSRPAAPVSAEEGSSPYQPITSVSLPPLATAPGSSSAAGEPAESDHAYQRITSVSRAVLQRPGQDDAEGDPTSAGEETAGQYFQISAITKPLLVEQDPPTSPSTGTAAGATSGEPSTRRSLQRHKTTHMKMEKTPRGKRELLAEQVRLSVEAAAQSGRAEPLEDFLQEQLRISAAQAKLGIDALKAYVDERNQTILHIFGSAGGSRRLSSEDVADARTGHSEKAVMDVADKETLERFGKLALASSTRAMRFVVSFACEHREPDLDATDDAGWTALLAAAAVGDLAACWLLLEAGAKPFIANAQGSTPLHYLARHIFDDEQCFTHEHAKREREASTASAAPKFRNLRRSFLRGREKNVAKEELRAKRLQAEMAITLLGRFLQSGANVNAKNNFDETPLMQAAGRGNILAVRFLLQHGADWQAVNSRGETAHYYAENSACTDTSRVLKQHERLHGPVQPLRQIEGVSMLESDFPKVLVLLRETLETTARKGALLTYQNTFTGEDLVNWILKNMPVRERSEGAAYASRLLKAGFIKGTGAFVKFKDSPKRFYVFGSVKKRVDETETTATPASVALSDFTLNKVLGRGSFGLVFLATHSETHREYALKKIQKSRIQQNSRDFRNLMAEKDILQNDSIFLCNVHFAFQTATDYYLAMDFLGGGDLGFLLRRLGRVPEPMLCFLAAEIALGLAYMHSRGIIYRDLKPANVLLSHEGHAVLADFGLSKLVESTEAAMHTACGTPVFSAPEVIEGENYGATADWWSYGIVLYMLVMGNVPFRFSGDFEALLGQIYNREPRFRQTDMDDEVPTLEEQPISVSCRNFIRALLTIDATRRLGDLELIKRDPFFGSIDWQSLSVKKVPSPVASMVKRWQDNFDPKLLEMEVPELERSLVRASSEATFVSAFDYVG